MDDIFAGFDALSQDLPGGGYPAEPNLLTPPEVMAIGRLGFQADDSLPASSKADWPSYWDTTAETITSLTGELVWDYGNRIVSIESEKTQGVIGWAGGRSIDLPALNVMMTTPFASLLFTPLDDRPLIESGHILITALARDVQLGGQYSPDGNDLLLVGGPPLLLEPVQATLSFAGEPLVSARVVDVHGVPTSVDVPITGGSVITIDGNYETYYYELRRDIPDCDPFLARSQMASLTPMSPRRATIFLTAAGADGVSLDPAAPLADVPYQCPFASDAVDPEPVLAAGSNPLIFYQMSAPVGDSLRLVKEGDTVRVRY